ncbi:MAG: NAD(P)/FAD-dependent oxidoreductase, partial [Longimicrobiales bacterium]|nr:NAD(P)/FAD-dependent oxidoreductase [Longimicrobiales bacterium]
YRTALQGYRYGPAAWKVDWALDGPIPWTAPECARAITVHVGGSMEEIARSEAAPWNDAVAERPFVLLAQPSLFDETRAPEGKHTAWAYCHVPHGWGGAKGRHVPPGRSIPSPGGGNRSPDIVTERIESQVERFAPGFRDRILARSVQSPADLESRNPNLVGGDIGGGVQDLGQLFFRPVAARRPYRTPVEGLYLCSSSTPPGGGVHGMCGFHAARTALGDLFG